MKHIAELSIFFFNNCHNTLKEVTLVKMDYPMQLLDFSIIRTPVVKLVDDFLQNKGLLPIILRFQLLLWDRLCNSFSKGNWLEFALCSLNV